jgi:hypothetical protein
MDTHPRLVISYHRDDCEADAGRLSDTLKRRLGDDRVFIDVTDIEFGANWERVMEHTLHGAIAVLLVAGPGWKVTGSIDYELSAALEAGIAIIPVVVRHANWAALTAGLPQKLQALRKFNAPALDHATWGRDVEPLALLLERMLADAARAKVICRPPEPAVLLQSHMNRNNTRWLLIHAADLAECLADPTVLTEAQRIAAQNLNRDTVPPELIHVLGNARSRLMTEELARRLVESSGEGAAKLLRDPTLEAEVRARWNAFEEAKREWSRTRGDSNEHPGDCQRDASEVDAKARARLREKLPGLTRDPETQAALFELIEGEVRRILTQGRLNDYWEYAVLEHFARCPDKRYEVPAHERPKVQKMLDDFRPAR